MSTLVRRESLSRDNVAVLPAAMSSPALHSLLAGGVAGIVSRTTVAPIERVKILLQVQSLSARGDAPRHSSILGSLRTIVRADGVRGLWKGNTANCVRVFPSSAIQFWACASAALSPSPSVSPRLCSA